MYKFIHHEDFDAHEIVNGEKVYTNPLRSKHPNARTSPDGTEVVISTNHHSDMDCNCMTHQEAKAYIAEKWKS